MRRAGLSLRAIATALQCSLAEIHRLLKACVQGSPGLSDFTGVSAPSSATADASMSLIDSSVPRPRDVLTPQLSGSRAVVSAAGDDDEHVPTARIAEPRTSVDSDRGRGVGGETNAGESSVAYIKRRIREIVASLRESERPP